LENIISILVPLVVILAILLPRLWRSKSAARAGAGAAEPKKPGGLLDAINRKLEELAAAERAKPAREADDDDDNPWSRDDEDDNPWSSGDEPEAEAGPKKTTAPPVASAAKPEPAAIAPPVDRNRSEPVTPRKAARVEVPAILPNPATGSRIGREELRRAIVWSEILAPPLALRKPEP
jgi:FtsZ-interacting cell division protein ZipA